MALTEFYETQEKQLVDFSINLHRGALQYYQAVTNNQIKDVVEGLNDNALRTAATLRASQSPIMPNVTQ